MQKYFGPVFFLPKFLIPNYFNYYKKLKKLENADTVNCPICFVNLTESPEENPDNKTDLILKRYMETPCNHTFHESCLKLWMEQKLVCPCCRMKIPPY